MAQRHGVLVPGRPMPTHPVVKVAVKTFRYERVEMTTVRWFILAFALEAIVIATLCMIGSVTGRFGPHKIHGGSATDFAPQGSVVWSWPMSPKINDRVMAWVKGDPTSPDLADRQPGLALKRFRGDTIGLDSTTSPDKYLPGEYEIRSTVFAVWHTEKWFPWLNTGTQKALKGPPTTDQQLSAAGSRINASAEQRALLNEQLKGSIQFTSEAKQIGDRDLDCILPLAREQQVSLKSSRPFTKAILWLSGDDIAIVNGQSIGSGNSVTVVLPKPSTVLTIKCVPSAPMAPPGMIVREVVLKQ